MAVLYFSVISAQKTAQQIRAAVVKGPGKEVHINIFFPPFLLLLFLFQRPSSSHTWGCPQMPIWCLQPYLQPEAQAGQRQVRNTLCHTVWAAIVMEVLGDAYNGLAVLSKGGFDKHGSESEAQGAVCVADAQLPAWSAALQHQVNTSWHVE